MLNMKAIKIILFACLLVTACEQPITPSQPPNTPDNNATIAAGVAQGLTEQANGVAITQTLAATIVEPPLPNPTSIAPTTIIEIASPTTVIIAPTNPPTMTGTAAPLINGIKPQIILTYVPPKGSTDFVEGRVEGVDPSQYQIAIYIKVGGGWWTKPTFAASTTPISSDGTWSTAYATGGNDPDASTIVAYLIPIGYYPPAASGDTVLPSELEENAVAKAEAAR